MVDSPPDLVKCVKELRRRRMRVLRARALSTRVRPGHLPRSVKMLERSGERRGLCHGRNRLQRTYCTTYARGIVEACGGWLREVDDSCPGPAPEAGVHRVRGPQ